MSNEIRTLKYERRTLIYDVKDQNCIFYSVDFGTNKCESLLYHELQLKESLKNNRRFNEVIYFFDKAGLVTMPP